jgi:hypothetical protein
MEAASGSVWRRKQRMKSPASSAMLWEEARQDPHRQKEVFLAGDPALAVE